MYISERVCAYAHAGSCICTCAFGHRSLSVLRELSRNVACDVTDPLEWFVDLDLFSKFHPH